MVNHPILSKKDIDGLPLEIDTHRYFWTSKMIIGPVRIFLQKYITRFRKPEPKNRCIKWKIKTAINEKAC